MPRKTTTKTKQEVKKAVPKAKDVLKAAKTLGLFKHNKMYSRYEIVLSTNDYKAL